MEAKVAVLRQMGMSSPYMESKPLAIETVRLDAPSYGEVLVRIEAAGLCHSDLSVIEGNRPRPMPMALGHEAAGVVEALGEGVDSVNVGDHVVMVFMPSCGHCLPCAEGRPALCEPGAQANGRGELLGGGMRLASARGEKLHHHLGCSAFGTHAVVSQRSIVKIDPDLPLPVAALFGCAVLTGMGAVVNTAKVRAGESVVIIGLGGVGLAALLGALAAGANPVIAIDLEDDKLALAKELGATAVFNGRDPNVVEQVRTVTGGGGDYAFEFAGSPVAFKNAYAMTRRGGTTVTAGLPPPGVEAGIDIVGLVGEERTVKGSYIGTCIPQRDIPRYIALYKAGRLPVDRLMTDRIPLENINAGFDALRGGQCVRLVVDMNA